MKIIQVMAGDEEGGLENHFVELANGLAHLGVDVVAVGHQKYADRFDPKVQYRALDLSRSRKNPWVLLALARLLRRERGDLVHAQANKAVAMLAAVARWVPGLKLATIHSQKKSVAMYKKMDAVIGVSKGVVANLAHPQLHIVHNGMVPFRGEALSRSALAKTLGLAAQQKITLAVGRLVKVKAYDNLINAWMPEFGQLVLIGEGPEQAALAALIETRGLQSQIILAGFRSDVRALMAAADLMVFSSDREGFSYALVEALLAQLPVVSTRVAGAEDILPAEHLVAVGDPEALRQALRAALADPAATAARMAPAFTQAAQKLTVEHMVAQTHQIYQRMLQGS